ncbi:Phosphopantetheine attachment site [Hoeflea phototrophica DFL-43]|jgi:acyl carrier protein|uniref:Phosphopantetheine attachment site n=1 Tax=Hoeflea phototrophica (strain DSM 17068 / NCIMB 14078 / DFL-43) TaxID=411684 RepID=A9DB13_HOEPD|nr:phosphopantetheine-binding protein [Hoeflea phototrophica]EDQ32427.1 Phosphopantetheine attachment site [Hoeflea phototrophica DFL-43]
MTTHSPNAIREMITVKLTDRGHSQPVADDQSLFFSGLLDSLAATEIMMLLESDFGIDLADADFDITELDTIAQIEALASRASVQA